MRKTGMKYLRRSIRQNGVSFFAVAFIAACSIAIFLGLWSSASAILKQANRYFVSNRLETLEISCAVGLTQEDVEAIAQLEGVDAAEGGYSEIVIMRGESERITLQALSLCDEQNVPVVIEGTLPAAADEVAIEEIFAQEKGIQVGDILTLEHDGALVTDTFTVTAIINQPMFCCADLEDARGSATAGYGAASYYIALLPEAFDSVYYGNSFTRVSVRSDALDALDYYSAAYAKQEAALKEEVEELGQERAALRADSLPEGITSEWIVSVRNDVGDIRGVKSIVDGIYGVSYSVSLVFLLVAIVVCYSALTRLIDDQRTRVGAQKALGFGPGEILRHYLLYNTLCAVLGIAVGVILSLGIVELVVLSIFSPEFLIGTIPLTFSWQAALPAAGICLAIFLIAAWAACAKMVKEPATDLLRGRLPVREKPFFFEKWKGYRRLRLYSRTMIKNVLSDRGRMMTTIVGVAGCVALLVLCFSLKMSMDGASRTQFARYFLYENRLEIDTGIGSAEDFEKVLEEEGVSYTVVQDKLKRFRVNGGDWENAHVVTASDFAELEGYMVLEDIETKETAQLPENGLLVSRKCAEIYGLSEGSVIELMDTQGDVKEFAVAGVIEHYLPYHLFVTTDDYYEATMGEPVDACIFLLKGDIDGLYEKVRDLDGFLSLKDNSDMESSGDSINMVIAICLFFSVVIALLVLLNQITMHINRKSRELAVMRINGYTLKETRAYIYKDNIVLTAIGLVVGCAFGLLLAYIEIRISETGALRYVRTPNLLACLYSCVAGVLLSVMVNLIALRRIGQLNLTDINGNQG